MIDHFFVNLFRSNLILESSRRKVVVGFCKKKTNKSDDCENCCSSVMQWNKTGAPAYSIGIHPDKTKFIMGNKQGTLMYYDLTKPDPLCELQAHEGVVYSAEWNKESSMIATASSDGLIHLTDLRSAAQMVVNRTVEDAAAAGVCYQALWKGEYELLSCGDDYCMKKWDIRALKSGTVENYFGHTSPVRAICLSPCEKYAGT